MKLYTEEQLKSTLIRHLNFFPLISLDEKDLEGAMENPVVEILKELTPIELPSDEEIWEKIEDSPYSIEYDTGFMQGAKWVIEQIKQKDNGK